MVGGNMPEVESRLGLGGGFIATDCARLDVLVSAGKGACVYFQRYRSDLSVAFIKFEVTLRRRRPLAMPQCRQCRLPLAS